MANKLKDTLNLPRTDFPMRAGLVVREPHRLEHWDRLDAYGRMQEANVGGEPFVLHDGPPFTNGDVHIGTALNKILKDVINRSQRMLGKDANYVPGWDCRRPLILVRPKDRYLSPAQRAFLDFLDNERPALVLQA